MLTLLTVLGSIVSYFLIGFITNKLAVNAYFKKAYREILPKTDVPYYYGKKSDMSKAEQEYRRRKEAWSQAKGSIDARTSGEVFGTVGAILWPLAIPVFVMYFGFSRLNTTMLFKSSVEREIEKYEKEVELEKTREVEWKKTLDQAEAMGLDVTELRKL